MLFNYLDRKYQFSVAGTRLSYPKDKDEHIFNYTKNCEESGITILPSLGCGAVA
jgi:hypothetical protein